jgi:hypothetical protein
MLARLYMSKDDYATEPLWEQMQRRKNAFLNAMRANDVSQLPRIRFRERRSYVYRTAFSTTSTTTI